MRKNILGLAVLLLIAALIADSLLSPGHPPRLMHFLIEDVFETILIVIIDSIRWIVSFITSFFSS